MPADTDPAEFRRMWLRGQAIVQQGRDDPDILPPKSPLAPGSEMEPGREVWWRYATQDPDHRVELLIEADDPLMIIGLERSLARAAEALDAEDDPAPLMADSGYAVDGRTCALRLTFEEFLAVVVPLTHFGPMLDWASRRRAGTLADELEQGAPPEGPKRPHPQQSRADAARRWFLQLLVTVAGIDQAGPTLERAEELRALLPRRVELPGRALARVSLNRPVDLSLHRSRRTVKADAAALVFGIRCDEITWAVVDSGIDARHHQFRTPGAAGDPDDGPCDPRESRVVQTFDFTRLRDARNQSTIRKVEAERAGPDEAEKEAGGSRRNREGDLPATVVVDPDPGRYTPPAHPHGTHVAGIIGGLDGLCPDIRLYDYRVIDETGGGREFSVVAALRDILERNRKFRESGAGGRTRDLLIHGVNLSLSLDADVPSDACGWSLICRVCDELVRTGVVVVVAAGNTGYARSQEWQQLSYGYTYRTVSIADPGNTERVITVGSTHPDRPLEHGISFFSARGPTADGRHKPDLVAPGDGIESALGYKLGDDDDVWNGTAVESGTSQAAAHVSGCAAMLIARNRELIGKPDDVKQILCRSATDLGRDRNFQGSGLVDALRALQEI